MIDRVVRRLPVRVRFLGGSVLLVVLLAGSVALVATNQAFLIGRLQQVTGVQARADRLLLLAAARVESSRVNLMRYVQDYAPSAYEALDDVDQAGRLLADAQALMSEPDQQAVVATVLAALGDYRALAEQVQAARSSGDETFSPLLFQAYRLGNDIAQRIEEVVQDSEARVAAANEAVYAQARRRLALLAAGYLGGLLLAMSMAWTLQRSITRPIADLRRGAEAFRRGQMETRVAVTGADELSLLGRTFNDMAGQMQGLIDTLEQRVARRTRDLEQRAVQLATAAEVGRAAASILDVEKLSRQVVDLIRGRFELYYAGLFLLDEEGRYAVLEAGTGEAGRLMKEQGHKLEVGGASMVGTACAQRRARIALDVGQEAVRFDNPLLPRTRSEMAIPLVIGEQVLGALNVQSTAAAAFSAEDITALQLVADQVAAAVGNARLFSRVQTALDAERQAYGQVSRQSWVELARGREVVGYSGTERGIFPVTEQMAAQMEAAAQAAEMLDEEDRRSGVLAPIRVRDRMIGLIDARKPDGAAPWTEQEASLLHVLAEQLGLALEGARLHQTAQRRAAREQLVGQITARMRETLDIETVLKTALLEIGATLGISRINVHMASEPPGNGREHGMEGDRDDIAA